MSAIEHIKAFLDMGFTPAAAISLVGIGVLYLEIKRRDKNQRVDREAWHAETRVQLTKLEEKNEVMEQHVVDCNEDREVLHAQISDQARQLGVLEERTIRLASCNRKDCPMRPSL